MGVSPVFGTEVITFFLYVIIVVKEIAILLNPIKKIEPFLKHKVIVYG